jgi:hypothetical protein
MICGPRAEERCAKEEDCNVLSTAQTAKLKAAQILPQSNWQEDQTWRKTMPALSLSHVVLRSILWTEMGACLALKVTAISDLVPCTLTSNLAAFELRCTFRFTSQTHYIYHDLTTGMLARREKW